MAQSCNRYLFNLAPFVQLWPIATSVIVAAYLITVRVMRYRRRDELLERYGHKPLADMTSRDAFEIQHQLLSLEFPTLYSYAGFFALFKTYGIPSISGLLLSTGHLSSTTTTTSTKRLHDTGAILNDIISYPPTHTRTIDAIARMNYLHGVYRRNKRISDADMLYTLSLFALEGKRWIEMYEWRRLTELEICAMGKFWFDLGVAMEIPFDLLLQKKPDTLKEEDDIRKPWPDALCWLTDLEIWSTSYEAKHMVPAKSNEALATSTLKLALYQLPKPLHASTLNFISILLGERLRTAMLFRAPPALYYVSIFRTLVTIRKLFLRHLCLPRPYRRRRIRAPQEPDPVRRRYHAFKYRIHPWYMKPTVQSRRGLKAWWTRWRGGVLPGDEGDKYRPEGYLVQELGPDVFLGKGLDEMEDTRKWLGEVRAGEGRGCPFAGFPGLNEAI